jgi:hypothetical protein
MGPRGLDGICPDRREGGKPVHGQPAPNAFGPEMAIIQSYVIIANGQESVYIRDGMSRIYFTRG